jgi:signal transduction histidine kinase
MISEFEFVHRDQSGEPRQIAVTVSPIPDRAGARIGALASFRDITNRVKLVEQLGQHRKMASLGEMAGAMAHHFNNILGGIVTSVDFALATGDPDIRHRVLQKSAQALGRATRLVDSLLAFAEGDHRHADEGDLTETVIRLVDEIEPDLSQRGMELALEIDPIPTTPIYQKQINTILINLIENAVQAMVRGDTLTVRLGTVGENVRLEVADSGCGMTDEETTRIFEPFYSKPRGKRASLGGNREGLGLAVVHGIVQDMNGSISVSTAEGKGTTITILLPRHSAIRSS